MPLNDDDGVSALCSLTVCMMVDSALDTSTNTSASRQCLLIHWSKSGSMSIPGLGVGQGVGQRVEQGWGRGWGRGGAEGGARVGQRVEQGWGRGGAEVGQRVEQGWGRGGAEGGAEKAVHIM